MVVYESGRQYIKYAFAIRMKSERTIHTPYMFLQIHYCSVRNRGGVFSDAEPDTVTYENTNNFLSKIVFGVHKCVLFCFNYEIIKAYLSDCNRLCRNISIRLSGRTHTEIIAHSSSRPVFTTTMHN